ncbi:MAG: ECF-type sigma factor, partial [Acidobacteriota bacterium]
RDSFADDLAAEQPRTENVLALDGALDVLERQDPTLAEIVKMRFYAGLTIAETAKVLSVSSRTVNRQWLVARAWLAAHLRPEAPDQGAADAAAS